MLFSPGNRAFFRTGRHHLTVPHYGTNGAAKRSSMVTTLWIKSLCEFLFSPTVVTSVKIIDLSVPVSSIKTFIRRRSFFSSSLSISYSEREYFISHKLTVSSFLSISKSIWTLGEPGRLRHEHALVCTPAIPSLCFI